MAFSVFSKPLSMGRAGMYYGGGAAVGAGVGAAMAGKDHRVAGAMAGQAVGSWVGAALAIAHASRGTGAASILRKMPGEVSGAVSRSRGMGMSLKDTLGMASGRVGRTVEGATMSAIRGANMEAGLAHTLLSAHGTMKRGINRGLGMLGKLRA